MDRSKSAILRAKVTYYFKETFRAHSKAEYREIFSRGLNEDNGGITGSFPWFYVRAFFALLLLFTVNTLVLRLTNNTLYVPSVTFLGGITFTIPFIVLLYELYPKRDLSLFLLLAVLVIGGTAAGVLCQFFYSLINLNNVWVRAVSAGFIEELCKAVPAIMVILLFKTKNPYACFLIGAAVGAGFSVIEDMGYIFYYSDKYVFNYQSDIQAKIAMFVDRGITSFCTHVLWTGAVGWAYGIAKRPFRSVWLIILTVSIAIHICWDLPLNGFLQGLDLFLCVIIAAAINIAIAHKSRINTIADEMDLQRVNREIINEARAMGERMRFTNAANLTFALTLAILSVIVLLLCALPIGMEYQSVEYADKEEFIAFIEDGYDLTVDWDRKYDPDGYNVEERSTDNGEGELELSYVIQRVGDGRDGIYYYYGYHMYGRIGVIYSISVEIEELGGIFTCSEYIFGSESEWAFDVNADLLIDYTYETSTGKVTAVTDAEEFEGYNYLIGLCATGCAVTMGCTVILIAFGIKLRRVKDGR